MAKISREQRQRISAQADAIMSVCLAIGDLGNLWDLFVSNYIDFPNAEQAALAGGLQFAQRGGVAAIISRAGRELQREADAVFMAMSDIANELKPEGDDGSEDTPGDQE